MYYTKGTFATAHDPKHPRILQSFKKLLTIAR